MDTIKSILLSVSLLDEIKGNYSLMLLETDKGEIYYKGDYQETIDCINKEIEYTLTQGFAQGKVVDNMVENLIVIKKVNTLDAEDNIKLFTDDDKNESDVYFTDIEEGDPPIQCIVFCVNAQAKSSNKADWIELLIQDKNLKIATCRLFSPEEKPQNCINKYLNIKLYKTAYGFQTEEFSIAMEFKDYESPRMLLCENYINKILEEDTELKTEVQKLNLISKIKTFALDEELGIGYDIIRLAQEISIAKSFVNITNAYDIRLLVRYFIMKRLYKIRYTDKSTLSPICMNVILFARTMLATDSKLLALIDPFSRVNVPERDVADSITNMANNMLKAEMTYSYEGRRNI